MIKSIAVKLFIFVVVFLYAYCLSLIVKRLKAPFMRGLVLFILLAGLYIMPLFLTYSVPWYLETLKPATAITIFFVLLGLV